MFEKISESNAVIFGGGELIAFNKIIKVINRKCERFLFSVGVTGDFSEKQKKN